MAYLCSWCLLQEKSPLWFFPSLHPYWNKNEPQCTWICSRTSLCISTAMWYTSWSELLYITAFWNISMMSRWNSAVLRISPFSMFFLMVDKSIGLKKKKPGLIGCGGRISLWFLNTVSLCSPVHINLQFQLQDLKTCIQFPQKSICILGIKKSNER